MDTPNGDIDTTGIGQQVEDLILKIYPVRLHAFYKHPLLTTIGYSVLVVLIPVIFTYLFGGFADTPDVIDLTEDGGHPGVSLVFVAAIYFYLSFPSQLRHTFDKLSKKVVFSSAEITVDPNVLNWFEMRWVRQLPYALTVFLIVFMALPIMLDDLTFWYDTHIILLIDIGIVFLIAWWVLGSILINTVLAIRLINAIFKDNDITVYPLDLDGSGGLGAIGRFSLRLSFFFLVYGVLLISVAVLDIQTGDIATDYFLYGQVVAYLIIVPSFFYWSIHGTHKAMVAFRDNLVQETSSRYVREHVGIHQQLPTNVEDLRYKIDYIEALQSLQKHDTSYPIWPFNMRIGLAVFANAIAPTIPTVVGVILDLLGQL